jgi:hypothetical protein
LSHLDFLTHYKPGIPRKMGRMAAQVILRRIGRPDEKFDGEPFQLVVEPELIIRGTTAAVPRRKSPRKLILLHQS